MATYLIDYENPVGKMFLDYADGYWLPNCCRISDWVKERYNKKPCTNFWETVSINDMKQPCNCNKVILFFSPHSPQAKLEEIKAKCTQHFKYVPNGVKNGLDFQLATHLGSLIHGDTGMPTDSRFYIVSGDKGFGSVLHFWEANSNFGGLSFALLANKDDFCKAFITEELNWLNIHSLLYVPNLEEDLELSWARSNRASDQCTEIISIFFRATDKESLHNKIQSIVGNGDECKKIYRLVLPLFNRYQKVRECSPLSR
jgi:hypothetical protein